MQTFDGTCEFRILMEACLSFAVLTGAPAGTDVRLAAMTINNLRPCTVESETLVARGRVLNSGPTFTLAEILVEDASGRGVAHGVGTYIVSPIDPAPPPWIGSDVAFEPPAYSTPDPYRRPLDPSLALRPIEDVTGLEVLQGYVRGELPLGPIHRLLGTKVVLAEEGEISVVFPASAWFCLWSKEVAPGVLASFVHHTLGGATGSLCPRGYRIGILEQNVTFLAPVAADGRELVGRGRVTHRRSDVVVCAAEFTDADGHVIAVGHQTSMIRPPRTRSGPAPAERRIITVLFSDIVKSTEQAAELGDARWTELLDRHHATIRKHLQLFKGIEVKTTGDGFLATFEAPGQAIQAARAIRDSVRSLGLEIRVGIHSTTLSPVPACRSPIGAVTHSRACRGNGRSTGWRARRHPAIRAPAGVRRTPPLRFGDAYPAWRGGCWRSSARFSLPTTVLGRSAGSYDRRPCVPGYGVLVARGFLGALAAEHRAPSGPARRP